jgi:hypothetical protein
VQERQRDWIDIVKPPSKRTRTTRPDTQEKIARSGDGDQGVKALRSTLVGLNDVPTLYVDGFYGASYTGETIKLNFISIRNDPIVNQRYNKAEFVMAVSFQSLVSTRDAINKVLAEFEAAKQVRERLRDRGALDS